MSAAGLYRRVLPSPPAIGFSSSEGKVLFKEALDNGTMEGFFKLICYFQTQSEPAYCGLASLSMVLNALAVDPGRKWKGPWRWFDESMLDCCEPLEKIKDKGISFEQMVCLAHCAGANVEAFRTNKSNIDEFRKYVISCSRSDDCHVISSYHRGTFQQTGTGHFSPIGGYHAGKDLVLILDVARFKYPPHWVPLTLLWKAMDTVVGATGLRRGFMLISSRQIAPSLFYTLSCKHGSWVRTAEYMIDGVPVLLSSDTIKDVKHAISIVFTYLPSDFSEFMKWVGELHKQGDDGQCISQEENRRISIKDKVLKEVQETDLYKLVTDTLSSEKLICQNEMATANQDGLPNIAASGCCKGAGFLAGKSCLLDEVCSQETGVRSNRVNDHKPVTVSENAINCRTGACGYSRTQPAASNDVLTELLLALPPQTWMGIKEKDILQEISCLVSLEGLSPLLKEEILHMRVQLLLPKRCTDNKIEDDLGAL